MFDIGSLLVGGATGKGGAAAARAAQTEAAVAKAGLPAGMQSKTVAAAGSKTLSGWGGNLPSGFSRVDPAKTLAYEQEMGHPIVSGGALDQGVPGRYFASHAGRQAAMLHPNAPVGVSSAMCAQCVSWFSQQATFLGHPQFVADPFVLREFRPGGQILESPQ